MGKEKTAPRERGAEMKRLSNRRGDRVTYIPKFDFKTEEGRKAARQYRKEKYRKRMGLISDGTASQRQRKDGT